MTSEGDFVALPSDAQKSSRGCGLSDWELAKRIARIAVPVYPSGTVGICLGLFSAALVGQLGDRSALAAVGLSNVMTNILGYSWLWGLSGAISTLSAQDWGAGNYKSVGINLQRGFLILLCFADLPLVLMWLNSRSIMESVGQPTEVARYVGLYTQIRVPGIFCETISTTMNRTLGSIGNTTISSSVSIVTAIVNVVFNMWLIPKYGFIGAPITATLCDVTGATLVCIFAFRDADFRRCWPGFDKRAWQEWKVFLKISLPSLVILASEAWCWNLQDFIAGFISEVAMATQAVAPSITSVLYITGMCISVGAGTVIGNLLGEGRASEARQAARLGMQILQVVLLPQVVLLFIFKSRVPYVFTQDEEVVQAMESLLPLTMIFSIFDTQQSALTGIISAAGQQAVAAPLIAICYWVIGVPLGIMLAFGTVTGHPLGLYGLWIGMVVAVICHCVSYAILVIRIDWDKVAEEVQQRNSKEEGDMATQMCSPTQLPVGTQPIALIRSRSITVDVDNSLAKVRRSRSDDLVCTRPVPPPNLFRATSAQ
eukprot:TRINITY_DN11393_c0_g2_i1.p1 TRINITY_DN11393_c0_g2~~TRINITY_DN11393_c0_g2_i1.p1  ORF type:complete len:541 (-),score=48.79 TRINITY_DN11393_c0_g2_i1:191-1813(-)